MTQVTTYKVLSIDAWRSAEGGWNWNNWFNVGAYPAELIDAKPRKMLAWFRENGMLGDRSKGRVAIEDDGYNVVIMARGTCMPLYAIEYGSEQS